MLKKKEPLTKAEETDEEEQSQKYETAELKQKLKQYEMRLMAQEEQMQLRDAGVFNQALLAQLVKMNELLEKIGRVLESEASSTDKEEEQESEEE